MRYHGAAMPLPYAVAIALLLGFAYLMFREQGKGRDRSASADLAGMTVDLTAQAKAGKFAPVIGMDEEIERLLQVAARRTKNNPLLVGAPGVGKTAVVEGLALRIAAGEVPEQFLGKRVLSLHLVGLMAGTKFRGALEERLRSLIADLEANPRSTILFVDEAHMIAQGRGGEGSFDIADILKPALARGDLQVIGATTWGEYERFIKPDPALERRFQPILVSEPSRDEAVRILEGLRETYEDFHGVCIPSKTVEAAVDASIAYIHGRTLPDKAIDLIDEAGAKVAIEGPRGRTCAVGLLHAASLQAKSGCKDGVPMVTPEDVVSVARSWGAMGAKG